jgi:hypothetical protein
MKIDYINGLFEGVGSILVWRNVYQLWIDWDIKGVYWPVIVFFTMWGVWNLYYYPALKQPWSFRMGVVLTAGNAAWVLLAIWIMS